MQYQNRSFLFIQIRDVEQLTGAIQFINRRRRIPVYYNYIIQTTPRRGWSAILIETNICDYHLLRTMSNRLKTRAFGLSIQNMFLSFRYYQSGQTKSAYESHLALKITDRLRRLLITGSTDELDLAEPSERLILQRYHVHQQTNSWAQPSPRDAIPEEIQAHYRGNIEVLEDIFKPGTDIRFISEILEPGFSIETSLDRLLQALHLPYLYQEDVTVGTDIIKELDILDANRWQPDRELPKGWQIIASQSWS